MEAINNKLLRTNTELIEALGEVKQLSGLLPICANCKKIREIDLGDNELSKINLKPLMNYTKIESISLERNKLKKIDLAQMGEKHKKYVLCTDPEVKVKSVKSETKKKKIQIVYSKGPLYSKEQEKLLSQFFL